MEKKPFKSPLLTLNKKPGTGVESSSFWNSTGTFPLLL